MLFTGHKSITLRYNPSISNFQELRFLIRDWGSSNKHPYGGGSPGGESYLNESLVESCKCILL